MLNGIKKPVFPLFDTHCHLDFEPFQADLAGDIDRAYQAGVEKIFIPSIGMSNWDKVTRIAEQFDHISYGLGMHPYFITEHTEKHLEQLDLKLAEVTGNKETGGKESSRCVALGECGLDFALTDYDEKRQLFLFEQQVFLARKYSLPLVLHCRKAHQPMIQILKRMMPGAGGVLHGFSGSYQQAKSFVELGYYIGVGGTITYPRANKTRKTISDLPLTSLVLETDAPDMPMFGYQGQPNHPVLLENVLNELILLRNEGEQTIAMQTWLNANKLFDL